jgi:hypothetical protein
MLPMHDEWEYHVDRALRTRDNPEAQRKLDALGKDGWELVSVAYDNNGY